MIVTQNLDIAQIFLVFREEWLDATWILIALVILHKGHKILGAAFVLFCMVSLRLLVELFAGVDFSLGLLNPSTPILQRGYWSYSVFIAIFFLLAYGSKGSDPYSFVAAAISMLIFAFCVSAVIMVL